MQPLDPEIERSIREHWAAQPEGVDRIRNTLEALEQARHRQDSIEKTQGRIRFIVPIIVSFGFGYIADRIAVALGWIPEEWLLSHILADIWHKVF
jgi:hypothetical protein